MAVVIMVLLLLLFSCSVVSNSLQPMDYSTPGFPVLHYLLEFAQTHVHWVSDAIQPAHPLLPSSPPALNLSQHFRIRWPKYWSFSFSISPFIEYLGLISFKIDWFDLLAVQETLQGLLQHKVWKLTLTSIHDDWKSQSFDSTDLCEQRWENWGSESGIAKIMYAELGLTTSNSVTFSYCYNLLQTGNIII